MAPPIPGPPPPHGGGGGNPPPTQATLVVSPNPVAFGTVTDGTTSSPITVTIQNTGNINAVITSIAVNGPFFALAGLPPLPLTLTPGQTATFQMTFTPATAINYTATLTIAGNQIPSPTNVAVTGTGTGASAYFNLMCSPPSVAFGNIVVMTPGSSPVLMTITNTGNGNCVVNSVASPNANFIVSSISITPPFTLTPGSSFTFLLNTDPQQLGNYRINMSQFFSLSGVGSGVSCILSVNGVLLIPAFPLLGIASAVLLSIKNAGAAVALKKIIPGNINCEETASFARVYDYGVPITEKNLKRIAIRYEDTGVAVLDCTASTTRFVGQPGITRQTSTDNITIGGTELGANIGLIQMDYFDIDISHELITVTISRPGNTGQVIIDQLLHLVEGLGEYIEAT